MLDFVPGLLLGVNVVDTVDGFYFLSIPDTILVKVVQLEEAFYVERVSVCGTSERQIIN